MRILAFAPVFALMLSSGGLAAHPHEGWPGEGQLADIVRQEVQALQQSKGAFLGISLGNWADGPVEGLKVLSVSPGGPAEEAGLRAEDLLTSIDDESLAAAGGQQAYERLRGMLAEIEAGSAVSIGYRRGGSDLETQVKTDAWEQVIAGAALAAAPRVFTSGSVDWLPQLANSFSGGDGNVEVDVDVDGDGERRIVRVRRGPVLPLSFRDMAGRLGGLQITELTPALGEYFGAEDGLLVVRAPESEEIELEDGDVIRKIGGRTFKDARQATRILRSYEPGEQVELEVLRHQRSRTVRFELPARRGG